jgi:GntR family transcriptional regulator
MFSRDDLAGLSPKRPQPLFYQLCELLKAKIERGDWRSGTRLPGELELARIFGLARITARRALQELSLAGWVERQPGVGTIVLRSPSKPPVLRLALGHSLQGTSEAISELTTLRLLECTRLEAPPAIAAVLRLLPPAAVDRVERLRLLHDEPIAYYLSHTIPLGGGFNARLLCQGSRVEQLQSLGVEVQHVDHLFSAASADALVARHLGVAVGAALLQVTRIATDVHGRVVDHLLGLYRPERFEYSLRSGITARRPR